jgi:hypothetical protein
MRTETDAATYGEKRIETPVVGKKEHLERGALVPLKDVDDVLAGHGLEVVLCGEFWSIAQKKTAKDITKLSRDEVVEAMKLSGYNPGGILSTKFNCMTSQGAAVYVTDFLNDGQPDSGLVFIERRADGKFTGEY